MRISSPYPPRSTGRHLSLFRRDITSPDLNRLLKVSCYDQIAGDSIHIIQALVVIAGQRGT
jgi:hypothetical protein